jgi:hypothetical protein
MGATIAAVKPSWLKSHAFGRNMVTVHREGQVPSSAETAELPVRTPHPTTLSQPTTRHAAKMKDGANPNEQFIAPLNEAIARYEAVSSFCCGGSLERLYGSYMMAGTHYGDFTSKKTAVKCAPVTVRWDQMNGNSRKITFDPAPIYRDTKPTLEDLVHDCEPATFGYNGKNVLNEAVRKAGKLEAYSFSTNFNPYDYGIIDEVARKLMPGIVRAGKQPAVDRWGVVAELYKLNVYSSPSGMFKPHVDTPRGRTQFGSLVVCLPTGFEGINDIKYRLHQALRDEPAPN